MLFEAIERVNNIDYRSQYTMEILYWLDSIALGIIVGSVIASIIYLFGFTYDDLYNEDCLYLFVVILIVVLGIGNLHTKMNYERYLNWIKKRMKGMDIYTN